MALNKYFNIVVIVLVGFIFLGLNISCDKNKTCKVNVKCVYNSSGTPVNAANVALYAPIKTPSGSTITADVQASGTTDGSGMVSFTFKLPAIFNVKATKDTLVGTSMATLEEGKTIDVTVYIK